MSEPVYHSLPDPERTGGPAWVARTGGRLSVCNCVAGAGIAAVQQLRNAAERLVPMLVPRLQVDGLPPVPDSRLVRLAEEAAMEQSPELRLHGFRSSCFGRALAFGDGVPLDPELFHLCALLHDVGIMTAVAGEDFTLRSAAAARRVAQAAGRPAHDAALVEDAITVHTTVGVTVEQDGALGAYTQFGAMVDLTGLRLSALPRAYVAGVLESYPRGPFKREILAHFDAEANAVPGGRFAFARGVGFAAAVRLAPFRT